MDGSIHNLDSPEALIDMIGFLTKHIKHKEIVDSMPKTSYTEVLEALKNSLRDLERVRMTAPDDPELLTLKRQIHKMIERAEDASK